LPFSNPVKDGYKELFWQQNQCKGKDKKEFFFFLNAEARKANAPSFHL
jgi:hypothetical protein